MSEKKRAIIEITSTADGYRKLAEAFLTGELDEMLGLEVLQIGWFFREDIGSDINDPTIRERIEAFVEYSVLDDHNKEVTNK